MATWEIEMTGLEIVEQDVHGWPVTRLIPLTMRVQEDNIIRLHKTVRKEAEERFPNVYAFSFNGVERVDKRTNKDYGFREDRAGLVYRLDPAQREELQRLKGRVVRKFVGESQLRDPLLLLSDGAFVKQITDDLAWLSDFSGIFTHEEAERVIKALQKFYERISREELAILRMDKEALTHDDLETIRAYRSAVTTAA
jgi:hypothetical protein